MYETVSWIQQLHAHYAMRTCYYVLRYDASVKALSYVQCKQQATVCLFHSHVQAVISYQLNEVNKSIIVETFKCYSRKLINMWILSKIINTASYDDKSKSKLQSVFFYTK